MDKNQAKATIKKCFTFLSTLRRRRFNHKLYIALILLAATVIACRTVPAQKPVKPKQPSTFTLHKKHDLWYDVRRQFKLAVNTNNPRIKAQINWYSHHPKYLNHMLNHAAPYLYYIENRISTRDLPGELVLVPLIESEYDPFCYSRAGASGLWQLMPDTGSGLGLKQNWWYDGRRDIYASTRAALDYLTHLHTFFNGDWLLALGAYDAGEGTIQRSINANLQHGRPGDFWSLSLPLETNLYVPRLLALSIIVRDPERYGITLPTIVNRPYFDQVDVGFQIDLTKAAKLAGINVTEMYKLNPGFDHWTTDPKGPHVLVLPIDKINQFKQNLAVAPVSKPTVKLASTIKLAQSHSESPPENTTHQPQRYSVKSGDTLSAIRKKLHVRLSDLRKWNHLGQSSTLHPGQKISYYS